LGRSLLTGGRCSEVAVNTGLTVHQNGYFSQIIDVMDVNMKFGQVQQKSKVEHNFKIIYFGLFRGHSNNT
jgi:hypothetical protein